MPVLTPGWSPTIAQPGPLTVDWSNPLTQGLNYVNVPSGLRGQPTYSSVGTGTFSNTTISDTVAPSGAGIKGSSASSRLLWTGSGPVLKSTGTVLCYQVQGVVPSTAANQFLFRLDNGAETNSLLLFCSSGTNTWNVGWYTGGSIVAFATPTGTIGMPAVMGFTWDATPNYGFWLGGQKNTSSGGAVPQNTTGYNLCIGNSNTTNLSWWLANATIGVIHWLAFWDRILSDYEIIYLSANPMCFLLPPEREMPSVFFPTSSFIPGWARGSNLPVIGPGTY